VQDVKTSKKRMKKMQQAAAKAGFDIGNGSESE
jgi:hypothetical protein